MPMMPQGFMPIRVFFEKRGRIKYISHLDTMRAFTRALGRTGLPLWHTEGFNPHLYLTFALPLSLGCEALCESFDVRLTEEIDFAVVADAINDVLPPGFRVLRIEEPVDKPAAITWADYDIELVYGDAVLEARAALDAFSRQPAIEVMKRTKKGDRPIDIAPHAQLLEVKTEGDSLWLRLRLAAGINLNINPDLYLRAFYQSFAGPEREERAPDLCRVLRLRLLDEAGNDFR